MNQSIDEEAIRNYCIYHELSRPYININKVFWIVGSVIASVGAVSLTLFLLADFPFFLCFDILLSTIAFFFASSILKFLVKCYQHYAPEDIRRKCSCMPSCSEYALLTLEKFIWPKALWKIWRRVTHTCSEPGYHVDYP